MLSEKWINRIKQAAWLAFWVYIIYNLKGLGPYGWITIGAGLGFLYGRFQEREKAEEEHRKRFREEIARQDASLSTEERAARIAAEERAAVRDQVINEMKTNLTPNQVAMLVIPDGSQECIDLHERIEREIDLRMSKESSTQTKS